MRGTSRALIAAAISSTASLRVHHVVVDLGNGDEDTYDICMDCYAMGRSCACISKLKFVEQFPWTELTQKHESWRHQILAFDGKPTDKSPMPIKIELDRLGGKRTLAQICQMELKKRPFRDIKKPAPTADVEQEDDVELDINGKVKKKKKRPPDGEVQPRAHKVSYRLSSGTELETSSLQQV